MTANRLRYTSRARPRKPGELNLAYQMRWQTTRAILKLRIESLRLERRGGGSDVVFRWRGVLNSSPGLCHRILHHGIDQSDAERVLRMQFLGRDKHGKSRRLANQPC
jgi:hypothetical protein